MKQKTRWISISLLNLCIVAALGLLLRTKFLFLIPFLDYKNVLSAHSHFAFGGWVTLILMVLLIDNLLGEAQAQKRSYQVILWGINLTAWGMLLSFPFTGYGVLAIIFSTLFIFFTYGFSWVFIKDVIRVKLPGSVRLLAVCSLVYLVLSSVGPFILAYMMATGSGDAYLFRDAVYSFLHFQYNGFFTLSIMALYVRQCYQYNSPALQSKMWMFALYLSLSVIPAYFLTLLWRGYHPFTFTVAIMACLLILASLYYFIRILAGTARIALQDRPVSRTLLLFSLMAFLIKLLLQMGTLVPALGIAVFGFRPIIIGFLHLVFLVMVSFFVLSTLSRNGDLDILKKFPRVAIWFFFTAAVFNETILLIDGIGLMFYITHPVYPWLLWVASMLLFIGATLLFLSKAFQIGNR